MRIIAKKRDLILIASLLLISFMILLLTDFSRSQAEVCVAVVEKNGEVLYRIPLHELTEPQELEIEGQVSVTLCLDAQGAAFCLSDCPDQFCVRSGKLTKSGQCAVCLPARVSLRLEGENRQEADGITG